MKKKRLKFHGFAFKNSKGGDFSVSKEAVESADEMVGLFVGMSGDLTSDSFEKRKKVLVAMNEVVKEFCSDYSIVSYAGASGELVVHDNKKMIVENGDLKSFFVRIKTICIVLEKGFSFDSDFVVNGKIKKIIDFDFESLPHWKLEQDDAVINLEKEIDFV